MAAPRGNDFYKYVKKPTGRPKKFTPATLWKAAEAYFAWNEKNPLWEMKVFANGKSKKVPRMRIMTEGNFCLHAGLDTDTFRLYKSNKDPYKEFFGISKHISNIIYQQKLAGASVDMLNPMIVARLLGLKEKQETEITNPDGSLTPKQMLTDDQFGMLMQKIKERRK